MPAVWGGAQLSAWRTVGLPRRSRGPALLSSSQVSSPALSSLQSAPPTLFLSEGNVLGVWGCSGVGVRGMFRVQPPCQAQTANPGLPGTESPRPRGSSRPLHLSAAARPTVPVPTPLPACAPAYSALPRSLSPGARCHAGAAQHTHWHTYECTHTHPTRAPSHPHMPTHSQTPPPGWSLSLLRTHPGRTGVCVTTRISHPRSLETTAPFPAG